MEEFWWNNIWNERVLEWNWFGKWIKRWCGCPKKKKFIQLFYDNNNNIIITIILIPILKVRVLMIKKIIIKKTIINKEKEAINENKICVNVDEERIH